MATRIPYEFATNGDTQVVPNTSDTDELSFQDGWSDAYEKKSDESGYRYMERTEHNYLWNVITANIKEWQEQTFPEWISDNGDGSPYSYPTASIVTSGDVAYISREGGNDGTPGSDSRWVALSSILALSSVSGVFTATNSDNNINLTGVGLIDNIEIGDVIQISGSTSNDGEYTVEVITDDDNVIVNQAHAGASTTKSLTDESVTSDVTVILLVKWHSAPIGIGQGFADVLSDRSASVTYTNETNRTISLSIFSPATGSEVLVDTLYPTQYGNVDGTYTHTITIPPGSDYTFTGGTFTRWIEMR